VLAELLGSPRYVSDCSSVVHFPKGGRPSLPGFNPNNFPTTTQRGDATGRPPNKTRDQDLVHEQSHAGKPTAPGHATRAAA
jgi:hypothetical protein